MVFSPLPVPPPETVAFWDECDELTWGIAIATKRHGWVTNEDKLEALMEGTPSAASAVDWGPDGPV